MLCRQQTTTNGWGWRMSSLQRRSQTMGMLDQPDSDTQPLSPWRFARNHLRTVSPSIRCAGYIICNHPGSVHPQTRSSAGTHREHRGPVSEYLDHLASAAMDELDLPGMAMAVTDRDSLLRAPACGPADLGTGTPVSNDTRFEIGSSGKPFTVISLLQLHEAGLLDLHAPVSRYLPWFHIDGDFPEVLVPRSEWCFPPWWTGRRCGRTTQDALTTAPLRRSPVQQSTATRRYATVMLRWIGLSLLVVRSVDTGFSGS